MRRFDVTCITLFGITVLLQAANAFECYQCNVTDSNCKDPFDKNAGVPTIFCYGSCYKIKGGNNGQQAIQRGCREEMGLDNRCDDCTVLGVKMQSCACNSNLCNGVLSVRMSINALVALIAVYLCLL